MKVPLWRVAFARSGDKGDTANVGLIAFTESLYPVLAELVTADRVKQHFKGICLGSVESLGGGWTVSLNLDAQGKTFSAALLRIHVDVPEQLVREAEEVSGWSERPE
ncbi:MAG: hypothetical protein P8Y10_07730 [Gemmatimonadales bacterium]